MNDPFFIIEPAAARAMTAPIIISVPHSGTEIPAEIKAHYREGITERIDDTDWFVHDLYNFAAAELGVTIIHARYSRWVIDLNRSPESQPLYDDGRIITGLTPTTDFLGNAIYADPEYVPDEAETKRRLENYYCPYHQKIESLLAARLEKFGRVLLWDAHSIRRHVPTIRPEPFPDLILGDNDEQSAAKEISEIALEGLRGSKYQANHNSPFKGGYITRHFGAPEKNINALQLEMAKIHYMDDTETVFNEERAAGMRKVLRPVFERLIEYLTQ